jgi:hypothetical protein
VVLVLAFQISVSAFLALSVTIDQEIDEEGPSGALGNSGDGTRIGDIELRVVELTGRAGSRSGPGVRATAGLAHSVRCGETEPAR